MNGSTGRRWDAIVVGGGHNGLVCGAYLARAGLRTLILERRDTVGGALATNELVPGVRVLWAHAGMSSGAAEVDRLVRASGDLLVELALRSDVAPGGQLDPAWRDLFVRYPDRFMVGTDTWVPSRWGDYAGVQRDTRVWLGQLPPDVARRLATENAEALARPRP